MTCKNMAALPVLATALLLAGCYKSADRTDGHVDPDAADTIDVHDLLPDLVPDMMPDYPPDLPPDPVDVPPDVPLDVPPDDWTDVSDAENFCRGFSDGVCAYFLECCTDDELFDLRYMELDCENPWNSIYDSCLSDFYDAMIHGRITIDFIGYASLLSQLDAVASSCPNFGSSPFLKWFLYRQWMGAALVGHVAEGERCMIDEECLEGLYCDVYTGLCAATARLGGVCREDPECGPGNVCNRGRCAEPQSAGGPCDDYEDCDVGLWCDGDSCQNALPSGAPCELEMMNCQGLCTLELPTGTCRDFCNGY